MFHKPSSHAPSPSPRLGNTCALTALKFLMVTALLALSPCAPARAQGYPGGGGSHTHNWTPGQPIGASTLIVPSQYVRIGETISVGGGSTVDADTCTNPGCPLGGTGYDSLRITAWSDGGGGGQFGKLVNGVFQTCPANEVTHYRAPTTPTNGIRLSFTIDDVPDLADDPPVTTEVVKVTAWEFTISNGAAGWVPRLDEKRDFTARIRPLTDHDGNNLASTIRFNIGSSSEPGYCLNATRVQGQANDTVGSDLKFLPPLSGFTISGTENEFAETTAAVTDATVWVACLDFGAYGTISATAGIPNIGLQTAHLEGSLTEFGAQMPVDRNNNHISDQSSYDGNGAPGDEDADNDPLGDGTAGDRLSRYEEYRGIRVNGARIQLDPTRKDVFVWNVDNLDASAFTTANLGALVHYVLDDEVDTNRAINFNWRTFHVGAQTAIRVTNGFYNDAGDWGLSAIVPGATTWVPNNEDFCKVYVDRIRGRDSPSLTANVGAGDTVLPVSFTDGYQNQAQHGTGGHIRVDGEIIYYPGITPFSFIGCVRGQRGTTAAAHGNGAQVLWFAFPEDQIRSTFAHEAGHLVNLEHRPNFWEPGGWHNIMNQFLLPGATVGNGDWQVFRDPARGEDALQGQFRVVP